MRFRELLLRSTLLAVMFTGPPIILLVILRVLNLINTFSILVWGIFAIFWTAFLVVVIEKHKGRAFR
ncbi:MAG: hypothetical protein RMJ14_00345 [Nitrososphaerota archaeon]|nr:hypothetical protein [Nitrososphaerota archaeon]